MHPRRPICAAVYDRDTGLILRILRNTIACESWIKKHFPHESRPIAPIWTKMMAEEELGKQLKLGLADEKVIMQLTYFSGLTKDHMTRNQLRI